MTHRRVGGRCFCFVYLGEDLISMRVHRFLVSSRSSGDPRAASLLSDAHALGFAQLTRIEVHDLYFVQGNLDDLALQHLATELLSDAIAQTWCLLDERQSEEGVIERVLLPGVTDPVAEQIVHGAHQLGITTVERAATGQRFVVRSTYPLSEVELHRLARGLLVNPVIHHYALGVIRAAFPEPAEASS